MSLGGGQHTAPATVAITVTTPDEAERLGATLSQHVGPLSAFSSAARLNRGGGSGRRGGGGGSSVGGGDDRDSVQGSAAAAAGGGDRYDEEAAAGTRGGGGAVKGLSQSLPTPPPSSNMGGNNNNNNNNNNRASTNRSPQRAYEMTDMASPSSGSNKMGGGMGRHMSASLDRRAGSAGREDGRAALIGGGGADANSSSPPAGAGAGAGGRGGLNSSPTNDTPFLQGLMRKTSLVTGKDGARAAAGDATPPPPANQRREK